MRRAAVTGLIVVVLAILLVPAGHATATPASYTPRAGDSFHYSDHVVVNNGMGNYTGYTDDGTYTGSIAVTGVAPNGTANATYQSSGPYSSSTGVHYTWSESGAFSFSSTTYKYVQGTDNQTGYSNPAVWFLIDPALSVGATFQSLNTPMTVVSTNATFGTLASSTGYAVAILAEGHGTYQRNDGYGTFTATYNLQAYFDPKTGYCLGYIDTETDSDGSGDGFTYTDSLTDTQTSFPVTTAAAPPPPSTPPSSSPAGPDPVLIFVGVAVLLVVVLLIAYAIRRSRYSRIPRHSTTPMPGTMPPYQPPPVNLFPTDQPRVQQIVVQETVKVPCRYCGTLMDSTATVCPKCGAPRT